jgi:acyl carrier protein
MISDVEYVAPETETQKQLVEIWQGILRREKIGIDDDFFNIGGDSIRAVKIVSELQRIFNVNIDIVTLFQEPNIRGLSEQIDNQLWQDATLKEEDVIDKTVI